MMKDHFTKLFAPSLSSHLRRGWGILFAFLLFPLFSMGQGSARYLGGDISLLSKYEDHGANYMTLEGQPISDMLSFFKQQGWNSMRVRLFVDPSKASTTHQGEGVCQDLDYVAALGRRVKEAGLRFMLDFHYSDTWTDPGQHSTPSAWTSSDPATLEQQLYDYTVSALRTLVEAGAAPDFIQPGNEITYGMLWPTGHCYPDGGNYGSGTFANFARYLKAGIRGCREVCPDAKIVIQTEMSKSQNVTNFYKTLKAYTDDYDIIGISYYPYFHGYLATLEGVINSLEADYPTKSIQIVETGYYHKWFPSDAKYNTTGMWPATDEGQRKFAADLVEMLNKHKSVDGLYWWWPEANEYGLDWNTKRVTDGWYNASLFDNETGRALPALAELKAFLPEDTGIDDPSMAGNQNSAHGVVYDLSGRRISTSLPLSSGTGVGISTLSKGIYIIDGRKYVVK